MDLDEAMDMIEKTLKEEYNWNTKRTDMAVSKVLTEELNKRKLQSWLDKTEKRYKEQNYTELKFIKRFFLHFLDLTRTLAQRNHPEMHQIIDCLSLVRHCEIYAAEHGNVLDSAIKLGPKPRGNKDKQLPRILDSIGWVDAGFPHSYRLEKECKELVEALQIISGKTILDLVGEAGLLV